MSQITVTVTSLEVSSRAIVLAAIENALVELGINASVTTENTTELNNRRARLADPQWVNGFKASMASEFEVVLEESTPRQTRKRRTPEEIAADKAAKDAKGGTVLLTEGESEGHAE